MRNSGYFATIAAMAALPALVANPLLAATATIHYVSQPGDYIGQGETHTYTQADGTFVVTRNFDNGVNVSFDHATVGALWWVASFAAADEVELAPGSYLDVQGYPFQDPGHPGLDFSGSGRGCNTLTGLFTVHDVVWDLFGVPQRFDADLEQHCEGAPPALFADVTYNFGGIGPLPIAHGNLLVAYQNVIYEYSPAGALVSIRPILGEVPGGGRVTEDLRDLAVGPSGLLHAFVGTMEPLLATGNPGTGTWREDTDPLWAIFNNGSYGGVAAYGDYVYVGDFLGANGILRFDTTDDYAVTPFDFDQYYSDLTMGWDGVLYALRSGELTVDRIDPATMALLGTTSLAQGVRGIAVNPAGEIFGAAWSGTIYKFSAAGAVLDSIAAGLGSLHDIDRDIHGRLVVGARDPVVGLTDESLDAVTTITLSASGLDSTFVAWSSPELANPNVIFIDGFYSGDMAAWSSALP